MVHAKNRAHLLKIDIYKPRYEQTHTSSQRHGEKYVISPVSRDTCDDWDACQRPLWLFVLNNSCSEDETRVPGDPPRAAVHGPAPLSEDVVSGTIWADEFRRPHAHRRCQRLVFRPSGPLPRTEFLAVRRSFFWIHCALVATPCSRIGSVWGPPMKFEGALDRVAWVGQACPSVQCPLTGLPTHGTPICWPCQGPLTEWCICTRR